MRHLVLSTLALAAASLPAAAFGAVTVYHGAPGIPGAVLAHDEATGAVVLALPELDLVELLPIEAAGRTALEEFLPGKARRLADVAGASRLALPALAGSLYHYARGTAGARTYGYFVVTRAGVPRVLVERAGSGASASDDPFLDRVAVAPDGNAFLCATRIDAGGDLLEVRFAADPVEVVDRTAAAPPLRFSARGLALTSTHAWALSGRGPLRSARTSGATAELVGFGGEMAPTYYPGELVTSARGSSVAFHAGTSATALHAWTATAAGPARRASTTPAEHSGAGTLPQSVDGPYLAVGDDGTWCAWRTRFGLVNDCVVARVAAPIGEVPENLTSDARFLDTLDEVAVFFFRGPNEVVFAVGEKGTPIEAGIEGVDIFRSTLAPGAPPLIQNLSGTSGDFSEPFTQVPELKPTRWILTPDRRSLLLHDDSGSSGPLYAVDTATGVTRVLLQSVKSFDWVEYAGRRFAFGILRDGPTRFHQVHSILGDLTGNTTQSFQSSENQPTRAVTARFDGQVSWLRTTLGGDVLQRVRVPSSAVETFGTGSFAPGQGWTTSDAQTFATGGAVWAWPIGAAATSWPVAGPFQVLPGA